MKSREEFAKRFKEQVKIEIKQAIDSGLLQVVVATLVPTRHLGFVEDELKELEDLGYKVTHQDSAFIDRVNFVISWSAA